jgi:hypothetical protein
VERSRAKPGHRWEIITGPEFREWRNGLAPNAADSITATLQELQSSGPTLPSKLAKKIKSSHHGELHELRSLSGHRRILFARDGKQRAVLLLGGDKTNAWRSWYDKHVPIADELYREYRKTRGGDPQWRVLNRGSRSKTLAR